MKLLRGVTNAAMVLATVSCGIVASVTSCSSDSTSTVQQASLVSPDLVISQVYGAGGNGGATYDHDFVEIFNRGSSNVQLLGYSVQYASKTGTFSNNSNTVDLTSFVLAPGQYYLLQLSGGANGMALPSPDQSGAINMSATDGKVALVLSNNKLNGCGSANMPCNSNNWVDYVGFGAGDTYEGTGPAGAISTTTSAFRASGGCTDTGDNKNDFAVANVSPRNSQTSKNVCATDAGDSGSDSAIDGGGGGGNDSGSDSATDAGSDAPDGSVTDSGSDSATDAGSDSGSDSGISDSGSDAPDDSGSTDSGSDSGSDSGVSDGGSSDGGVSDGGSSDSGVDAGPVTLGKLVISQVYGGGGNAMATYTNDYVEIFNRDSMPLSTNGYSIQYASATGTFSNVSNTIDLPALTLAPGQYFLVQLASGGATGMALPTPDATGGLNLGATNGKVALTLASKKLNGCGTMASPCMNGDWIDLVGFGSADFYEGAGAAPALSSTKAGFRAGGGCIDTDVNSADISANTPLPRNSASPLNTCSTSTDGGTMADSGVADSGGGKDGGAMDATVSTDGSMDGSKGADGGDVMDNGGGCGCSQAGPPDSGSALGGLAFAALLSRSLQRRKKRMYSVTDSQRC